MMKTILQFFQTIFSYCAVWTDQLLTATGGKGVVIAGFAVALIIGLLFIPLRGRASSGGFADYSKNEISSAVDIYKGKNKGSM